MKAVLRSSAILLLCLSVTLSALAQSRGSLRGLVVDAKGGAVRGARVILLINEKQAIPETFTNHPGFFSWDGLKPGNYAIAVEADGLTQSGGAQPVRVESGREFRVAIPLVVAAVEDSTVVSATRTDARANETSSSAFVISATELALT